MTNIESCPNCGAPVPEYCDGSGEVICSGCGQETDHVGCAICMFEGDDDGADDGQRLAA